MGADIWLFCEVCTIEQGKKVWFPAELEGWDDPPWKREGLVMREWNGILNGNLIFLVRQMERVKRERQISSDEDVRIIFWIV